MSGTQILTDSIFEAAACKFVGYPMRYLVFEKQYAIIDTGDLAEFLLDLREHRQGITDCLGLMETYDGLLKQDASILPKTELRPNKIETEAGREWTTNTISDAIILSWAGYPLLRTRVEADKVVFIFGYDDNLKTILKRFTNYELLIEPHAYAVASRANVE